MIDLTDPKDKPFNVSFYVSEYGTLNYSGDEPYTLEQGWKATFAKWQYIIDNVTVKSNGGKDTCGLCRYGDITKHYCDRCPIRLYTGETSCFDTPYYLFGRAHSDSERHDVAVDELAFLRKVYEQSHNKEQTI
jgi:hypothetical protein